MFRSCQLSIKDVRKRGETGLCIVKILQTRGEGILQMRTSKLSDARNVKVVMCPHGLEGLKQ